MRHTTQINLKETHSFQGNKFNLHKAPFKIIPTRRDSNINWNKPSQRNKNIPIIKFGKKILNSVKAGHKLYETTLTKNSSKLNGIFQSSSRIFMSTAYDKSASSLFDFRFFLNPYNNLYQPTENLMNIN